MNSPLHASARQDFSRKLKWDPSDFSGEKLSWRLLPSAARVRPASAAGVVVHRSTRVTLPVLLLGIYTCVCSFSLEVEPALKELQDTAGRLPDQLSADHGY